MLKPFSVLLLLCFANLIAFGQTEKYTVPVKWERYRVSDNDVSVVLPKLPVLVASSDVCQGEETKQYAAYADQTVYGLIITSRVKTPDFCSQIKGFKEFDEQSFPDRLAKLKISSPESTETDFKQNNLTIIKISGKTVYWLINDFENKRWFELLITGEDEEKSEVKNFIKSIEVGKNSQGIEIGDGADRAFGDEGAKADKPKNKETNPLKIALKTHPKYTDAARKAQIQGTVLLKVTFLANGGIGSIIPASELECGLTEQAIIAAQHIVFIPPIKDGVPYSVTKTVSYSFSIY